MSFQDGYVCDAFLVRHPSWMSHDHHREIVDDFVVSKHLRMDVGQRTQQQSALFSTRGLRDEDEEEDEQRGEDDRIMNPRSDVYYNDGTTRTTDLREAIVRATLQMEDSVSLMEVRITGITNLPTTSKSSLPCLVLTSSKRVGDTTRGDDVTWDDPQPCLLLPLSTPNRQLPLLRSCLQRKPISKAVLLQLNSLAVNRDGGLFDNLPYLVWSVDPDPQQRRYRDAAGNVMAERYHGGKRMAYNRFLGKDWVWRYEAIRSDFAETTTTNRTVIMNVGGGWSAVLQQLRDVFQKPTPQQSTFPMESVHGDTLAIEDPLVLTNADDFYGYTVDDTLTRRMLELQMRELEMDIAEWDYQIAVTQNDRMMAEKGQVITTLEREKNTTLKELERVRTRLRQLVEKSPKSEQDSTRDVDDTRSPSQAIIGPTTTGMLSDIDSNATITYTNPYDMFREILREQMKAEVIGAVLENTSLMGGTTTLGGAIILRRMEAIKSMSVLGETLRVRDETETFGNTGLTGGTTLVVECDADEAIYMSLACNLPIMVEETLWQRSTIMARKKKQPDQTIKASLEELMPQWEPSDSELSILLEGERSNSSVTERVLPIRIPRTTLSLFDEITRRSTEGRRSPMFPTENPIQSLERYDSLTSEDKARTLLGMSNFNGRLPRPRVIRSVRSEERNPLDELLLPLIDESVRRQYLIREAERQGDLERVALLQEEKSKRQIAKEKASAARDSGNVEVAEWWDNEAEFLAGLRADPTQDEGTYSRFLDRDEWYERQRQQQAKKLNRSKFGRLLDGIE